MNDENQTKSFHLDLELTRPDVVEWLESIPRERLGQEVENALAAGNLVLSLLQASSGEESMRRFFRPVAEKMDDLKVTISRMLDAAKVSQKIGELGEAAVAEHLKRAFPDDGFDLVSREGHQADLHAHFSLGDNRAQKALIEVKLYSNDVPGAEVQKFRRDLEETGLRYGLMVSLTSRITGISGPVHLENTPDRVAVYVPNAGLDGFGVLWGATVLKSIVLFEARSGTSRVIPGWAIEEAWARMNEEISALKTVVTEVRAFRESLQQARGQLLASLDDVMHKAFSAETRLQHSVERIARRLVEEFESLPQTGKPAELPAPDDPDAVLGFIEKLRKQKDKRVAAFETILDIASQAGLQIAMDPETGHWHLLRDGQQVAFTKGTKGRVDLCVAVDTAQRVPILASVEKLKDDHVEINGRDLVVLRECAGRWLAARG